MKCDFCDKPAKLWVRKVNYCGPCFELRDPPVSKVEPPEYWWGVGLQAPVRRVQQVAVGTQSLRAAGSQPRGRTASLARPIVFALAFMLLAIGKANAQTANYYSTSTASGTENSAVITFPGVGVSAVQPQSLRMLAGCNYNTSAVIIMAFDAAALPANATVPKMALELPAGAANAPACGSLPLPYGSSVLFQKGIVVAASTTGKTLTVDTTSGGNTFFEVLY